VSSTFLTLLVLPTVYAWVEERRLARAAAATSGDARAGRETVLHY
jgi:hypothetical protein